MTHRTRTVPTATDQSVRAGRLQELRQLPVAELARLLATETRRFLSGGLSDDLPGLALFSVAIRERGQASTRSDDAWAALYQQYAPLVLAWVNQHQNAAPLLDQEGSASLVNATFAKFAQAFTSAKLDNFDQLSAILHYLRLCVHSVITDEVRTHQFLQHEEPLQLTEHEPAAEDLADDVASTLSAQSLWQAIQEELNGKEERVLVYLTCIARMRPGEIRRQQPELFPTVEDVYRIKRNISERLRRNKRLQHLVR